MPVVLVQLRDDPGDVQAYKSIVPRTAGMFVLVQHRQPKGGLIGERVGVIVHVLPQAEALLLTRAYHDMTYVQATLTEAEARRRNPRDPTS